ncbi:MAG: hypothetical protein WCL02_05050 [bacterium]
MKLSDVFSLSPMLSNTKLQNFHFHFTPSPLNPMIMILFPSTCSSPPHQKKFPDKNEIGLISPVLKYKIKSQAIAFSP